MNFLTPPTAKKMLSASVLAVLATSGTMALAAGNTVVTK